MIKCYPFTCGGLNKSFSKTPYQKPHLRETFWKPSWKLPGNGFFLPGHTAERSTTFFDALETLDDALETLYDALETLYDALETLYVAR